MSTNDELMEQLAAEMDRMRQQLPDVPPEEMLAFISQVKELTARATAAMQARRPPPAPVATTTR